MTRLRAIAMVVLVGAAAAAAAGCHGHYARHRGPVVTVHHAHYQGCGHHYWHDRWYAYRHPASCDDVACDQDAQAPHLASADSRAVIGSSAPLAPRTYTYRTVTGGHAHGHGCGHYYWHSNWYGFPHSTSCYTCYGGRSASLSLQLGYGNNYYRTSYYRSRGWGGYRYAPHRAYCPPVRGRPTFYGSTRVRVGR